MALPNNPPISLSQILAEFGAPSHVQLSQLLRGGAWVPDTEANAQVPTSLPIKLTDFLGASGYYALASPASVSASGSAASRPQTGVVTVSVYNPPGPVTYQWQRESGSAAIPPVNPQSASTAFRANAGLSPGVYEAVFSCRCASAGVVIYSTEVYIRITIT